MNTDELKSLINKIKGDKKTLLLIIVLIIAMLLIFLSDSGSDEKENINIKSKEYSVIGEQELADEVESFIEDIKGAGRSEVILTFDTYEETVYAVDKENDLSADGSYDSRNEYVILDEGSSEGGLRLKIISPKIRGIAVLCQGGNDPIVRQQVVSVVSALFDIGTNKISVAVMAD